MASKRHKRKISCQGKEKYDTLAQAEQAAASLPSWNSKTSHGYPCSLCHKFHAGHKPGKRLQRRDFKN